MSSLEALFRLMADGGVVASRKATGENDPVKAMAKLREMKNRA